MEEGTFLGWLKKDGDTVKEGDPLYTLESDKAAQEVESTDSGILSIPASAPQTGDVVKVGSLLGHLLAEGEASPTPGMPVAADEVSESTTIEQAPHALETSIPPSASPAGEFPASPRARRAAKELNVDLETLEPTGKGGRIRERDVLCAQPQPKNPADSTIPAKEGREVAVTTLRRTIAGRMMDSHKNTAPVTLTTRADATNLVALRSQLKAAGDASLVPAYNDIVAKLTAFALHRHPLLAAKWDNERIILPDAIHIGIAVDTEHGLMVPVIRDVGSLSLHDVTRRSRDLIEATRSRRLTPADLQGGSFTITNLGSFGIEAFTPIINYPETAVLGLGAIRREMVWLETGGSAVRDQIMLSLTFDHRVVDGAPAARFLQMLRQGIENPAAWLLNDTVGL